MFDDQDPALSQEDTGTESTTVADPPATEEAAESPEGEAGEGAGAKLKDQEGNAAPADRLELVFAGEEREEPAPKGNADWARHRKEAAADKARIAELERKLSAKDQPAGVPDPGPEPTIDVCGWDAAELVKRTREWDEKKRRKDAADAQAAQRAESVRQTLAEKQVAYSQERQRCVDGMDGYLEAETVALSALDKERQALIFRYAKNPALVVGALGRKPKQLENLAKVSDLGDFIAMVKDVEASVTVRKKTQTPPPEKKITGSGSSSGSDSHLEKLRDKARSGDVRDFTDVIEYQEKRSRR